MEQTMNPYPECKDKDRCLIVCDKYLNWALDDSLPEPILDMAIPEKNRQRMNFLFDKKK
jgi:hypothetical protein